MLEHCPEDYEDWRVNKKGLQCLPMSQVCQIKGVIS